MINTLERWAISVKRRREERAEQKRQWEEQDRKRKDIERQIRVEGYRITFLQRQVERKREIDGLAGLIDLWSRAEKMKMRGAHRVPLSTQVRTLFEELWELTGTGRYCFPSFRTEIGRAHV